MKASISLAQMNILLGRPLQNLEIACAAVEEAARRGSSLLLLPELWSSGYDLSNGRLHAQTNRQILDRLQALATERKIFIGGSLLLEGDQGIYNTFVLLSPDREPVTYRKIHLFRLMDEEKWLQPGETPVRFSSTLGETGLAVCYDLRFPELFRGYALNGVQITLLVSEWPLRRIEHWKILLRARAVENQMFLAAVNSVGQTGDETFGGASAVISPWGETLVEGDSSSEALLTAEIDLDQVAEVRGRIPVFADRRPDIYE